MKILLVGGGSGGPVSPLLAVAEQLKKHHPRARFLFVGTGQGPERVMAEKANLPFRAIVAGKWRRYWSFLNLATPFQVLRGMLQSARILKEFRPDCVFGAGAFVQVPVMWTAWLMRIPVVIHQQDLHIGLANRLCQWCAKKITVTFSETVKEFPTSVGVFYKKQEDKVVLTGNAVRQEIAEGSRQAAVAKLKLEADFPTVLIMGGGTGADAINTLVGEALPGLTRIAQVIHITGPGKLAAAKNPRYHAFEFVSDMASLYAAADVVVARAGLSTLSELSYLSKVAILIPMPDTHQEWNAEYASVKQAALVLDQRNIPPEMFVGMLRSLFFHAGVQARLQRNIASLMPRNGGEKIADAIMKVIDKRDLFV